MSCGSVLPEPLSRPELDGVEVAHPGRLAIGQTVSAPSWPVGSAADFPRTDGRACVEQRSQALANYAQCLVLGPADAGSRADSPSSLSRRTERWLTEWT